MKVTTLMDAEDSVTELGVRESATSLVAEGSILVVARSGILAHSLPVARAGRSLAFNQDIKAIQVIDNRVTVDYIYWFLRAKETDILTRGVKKGATVHSLQSGYLEALSVPISPIPEQKRVVELMSRAENIVRMRREAEAKAREIIPALFHDMFGDPATNPRGWPVAKLGNLLSDGPKNGLYKHASLYGEGIPILRIDSFYDGIVSNQTTLRRVRVSEAERDAFSLREGDIVVNRVNSPEYLGKSAIVPELSEPTVFESNMMRLRLNTDVINSKYFIQLLQQPAMRRALIINAKHAINQSSINQTDVTGFRIIVPPILLQSVFVTHVNLILELVMRQAKSRLLAELTFQSLLAGVFADGRGWRDQYAGCQPF